jgi:membrane-associated phospholipid phosphatase
LTNTRGRLPSAWPRKRIRSFSTTSSRAKELRERTGIESDPISGRRGHWLARAVTELLSPYFINIILAFMLAWASTGNLVKTLLWGLLVALFTSLIPMAVIVGGARKGKWDGHHVRDRSGRLIPLLAIIVSLTLLCGLLIGLKAPRDMLALTTAMLSAIVVAAAITWRWKVSLHTAVAGGGIGALQIVYGWPALILWLLLPLVGWARVEVGDHSWGQVLAGAAVGLFAGGVAFLTLHH